MLKKISAPHIVVSETPLPPFLHASLLFYAVAVVCFTKIINFSYAFPPKFQPLHFSSIDISIYIRSSSFLSRYYIRARYLRRSISVTVELGTRVQCSNAFHRLCNVIKSFVWSLRTKVLVSLENIKKWCSSERSDVIKLLFCQRRKGVLFKVIMEAEISVILLSMVCVYKSVVNRLWS